MESATHQSQNVVTRAQVREWFQRKPLMRLLGVDGHKLPDGGTPRRWWHGVQVYLRPIGAVRFNRWGRPTRRMAHRIRVVCSCGRDVSAGRFVQHLDGHNAFPFD